MRVRYRKLTSEFDGNAYAAEVKGAYVRAGRYDASNPNRIETILDHRAQAGDQLGAAAVAAVAAAVSTPAVVSASEHEADLEEVRALLREGKLTGQDLVNLGSGWQSIGDCIPLQDDVAKPGFDIARAVVVACVLAFLAALVLLIAGA